MAKVATKATTKPAARAPQRAAPAASGGSKAQRAAEHQGRVPQPASRQEAVPERQPTTQMRSQVPATRPSAAPPINKAEMEQMPAELREFAGAGRENIGRDDLEVPRLKLIQGLSPELETYNDLRAGNFFHTASELIFDEEISVVPIFIDKRYLLWRPRDSGGGILARSDDAVHWSPSSGEFTVQLDKKDGGDTVTWKMARTVVQSGLHNWGTLNPRDPNSPPAATLMYNYVLAFPDHPEVLPAVLTFQRSSLKQGKRFNTKIISAAGTWPIFSLRFKLSAFKDTNARGQDFFNVNMTGDGKVEDTGLIRSYGDMYRAMKSQGLQIKDIDSLADEDAAAENAGGGDQNTPNF